MKFIRNHLLLIVIVCVLLVIVIYFIFIFNKTTISCNNRAKLTELIRMDLSDVEITDIQYKHKWDKTTWATYTKMFIFLKEIDELESNEYYFDSNGGGIYDPNLEYIPPGDIAALKEIGIELHQIQKHGGNYNQIRVGFSIAPYAIHWYQIDDSYDGKSNVVLVALVPRTVNVDVSQIIAEGNDFD